LRWLGWAIFLGLCALFMISMNKSGGAPLSPIIINDLRSLESAALLFYGDNGRWPAPGQEASLDVYMDRPVSASIPSIYAGVEISPVIRDASGNYASYIKLTLNGKDNNRIKSAQRKLRDIVSNDKKEIFEAFPSDGRDPEPYKSGLDFVTRMFLHPASSDRSPEASANEASSPLDGGETLSLERD
jgi:hypothetical protein